MLGSTDLLIYCFTDVLNGKEDYFEDTYWSEAQTGYRGGRLQQHRWEKRLQLRREGGCPWGSPSGTTGAGW